MILENSEGYEFFTIGGILETTHGETILRMEDVWWIYLLITSMVTNKERDPELQVVVVKKNLAKRDGELRYPLMSQLEVGLRVTTYVHLLIELI